MASNVRTSRVPPPSTSCSSSSVSIWYGFFFQAEDGIRDVAVTGVQTCALPICLRSPRVRLVALRDLLAAVEDPRRRKNFAVLGAVRVANVDPVIGMEARPRKLHDAIGRRGLPGAGRRDVEDALAVLRDHGAVDRVDAVLHRELAADRAEHP